MTGLSNLEGKRLKSKDIRLVQSSEAFPEQYNAFDPQGNVVGYLRLRWGFFGVSCPDCEGEQVYLNDAVNGDGFFFSNTARKKALRKAKAVIAAWCNEHPEVYGAL